MDVKLIPEVKQLWVRALRSGDYLQAQKVLRAKDTEFGRKRMCCLGVLCDLVHPQGWEGTLTTVASITPNYSYHFGEDVESGVPPYAIRDKLFLFSCTITDHYSAEYELSDAKSLWRDEINNVIDKLTKMNDDDNLSFDGIADWVEDNL